jgi:transcriptional regulator with XRE-family HTH domain
MFLLKHKRMNVLDNAAVAERLKMFREANGYSISRFAMQAGIDAAAYTKIENNALPINDDHLVKVLFAFPNLSRDYLIFGEGAGSNKGIELPKPQTELDIIKESISVAKAIIKIQPRVKDHLLPEQQINLYKERENKYDMSLAILQKAADDLLVMLNKAKAELKKAKK